MGVREGYGAFFVFGGGGGVISHKVQVCHPPPGRLADPGPGDGGRGSRDGRGAGTDGQPAWGRIAPGLPRRCPLITSHGLQQARQVFVAAIRPGGGKVTTPRANGNNRNRGRLRAA